MADRPFDVRLNGNPFGPPVTQFRDDSFVWGESFVRQRNDNPKNPRRKKKNGRRKKNS